MQSTAEQLLEQAWENPLLFSPEEAECLYGAASQAYEAGVYAEAQEKFQLLVRGSPLEAKYWHGFAASYQVERRFEEAMQGWSMVILLDQKDATAYFHAAECLFALGKKEEAQKALLLAEEKDNGVLQKNIEKLGKYLWQS